MKKNLLYAIIILGVLVFAGYNYIYKNHRNIAKETPAFTMTAVEIISDFDKDSQNAQQKYLDKTISIKGTVTNTTQHSISLNNSVFCDFGEQSISPKPNINQQVTIKGRFIGFDDLLEEIKLDQCIMN